MTIAQLYDKQFFAAQVRGSVRSASTLVPRILALHPNPRSVVDVGCGTGSWLREYMSAGVEDALGIDGYLPDEAQSLVPSDRTMRHDLSKPLRLGRRFDIAQSLEVAEHLPSQAAPGFVEGLVGLSDLVVFGAAIPGQGGTGHLNEQWQSYWTDLFLRHGYEALDVLRPAAWHDGNVEWWYAQNTLVFVNRRNPALLEHVRGKGGTPPPILDLVHPRCFRQFRDQLETLAQAGPSAPPAAAVASPYAESRLAALSEAIPRRFRRSGYLDRLRAESTPWKTYALRHPLQVAFWFDLWRVQRRRARRQREGLS